MVCDETKNLKKLKISSANDKKKLLELENDYYVSKYFSGDTDNYTFSNGVVYEKFWGHICQIIGQESEEMSLYCEAEGHGLDEELLADIYPIISKNWLMYYGVKESEDPNVKEYEAILLPEYNQPKVVYLSASEVSYYKAEYFFYHNNNYLVYHKQSYGIQYVAIEIYKRNGLPQQTIQLKIEGWHDHSYAKILLSPSGRYLLYWEKHTKDDNTEITVGKVVELMMDSDTQKFSLEVRCSIEDFKERYGTDYIAFNTYSYYSQTEYFLTDNKEMIVVDKSKNYVMFEDIKVEEELKDKFGKSEYDKSTFKTLNEVSVVKKNGGVVFYTQEEWYFLGFDSKAKTVLPLKKINFKINKGQITISNVFGWIDPSLIVINFSKNYTNSLILVWDVLRNREVYNFSTSKTVSYIRGINNKAGFILNGDTYVDLDKGLINYFFEYNFLGTSFYDQHGGCRINKDQDLILENGNLITKETLVEVYCLQDLMISPEDLSAENINLEKIRFQVEGSTSLHYYALDYEKLSLILDYMDEKRPEYLTAILMRNNKGKSPLDITIENESPKNTELMLRKLIRFSDYSLSILFYDKFSQLLKMNITAFHEYLDSCFFQTMQMKATKYLKLKQNKDLWLVPHTSCLIDEVFIEKYCLSDEKETMEKEKKIKEQEEKQKKLVEEQKRLDDTNQNNNPGVNKREAAVEADNGMMVCLIFL